VGNGNNDVGRKTPTRKTSQPTVQMSGGRSSESRIDQQMQAASPQNCGAMSQQGSFSFHGNQSAPQKLVQLVGYRDPKVAAEPGVRPRPASTRR
jgi:hypothetical protein